MDSPPIGSPSPSRAQAVAAQAFEAPPTDSRAVRAPETGPPPSSRAQAVAAQAFEAPATDSSPIRAPATGPPPPSRAQAVAAQAFEAPATDSSPIRAPATGPPPTSRAQAVAAQAFEAPATDSSPIRTPATLGAPATGPHSHPRAQAVAFRAFEAPATNSAPIRAPATGPPPPSRAQSVAAQAFEAPATGPPPPSRVQAVAAQAFEALATDSSPIRTPATLGAPATGPHSHPRAQAVAFQAFEAPAINSAPIRAPATDSPPIRAPATGLHPRAQAFDAPASDSSSLQALATGPPPPSQVQAAVAQPDPAPATLDATATGPLAYLRAQRVAASVNGPPPPHGPPVADDPAIVPQVWRILARSAAWIPAIGSRVYYFPQGHAENSFPAPDFAGFYPPPMIQCSVTALNFRATHDIMDEPFVQIGLVRFDPDTQPIQLEPPLEDVAEYSFYAKKLVESDIHGSLGLPKPLVHNMFVEGAADVNCVDIHGKLHPFKLRRGPQFFVTTGWSLYRNAKVLVRDDKIVFIKNRDGDLFVGIWRKRFQRTADLMKERMTPEKVLEAVSSAVENRNFVVEYCPRLGSQVCVVGAEIVEAVANNVWYLEQQIRMPQDKVLLEGLALMIWYSGKVTGKATEDPNWPESAWRSVKVSWNEDEDATRTVSNINPWQVAEAAFSRCNTVESCHPFPLTKLFNITTMGMATPAMFLYNIFPAGRQDTTPQSQKKEERATFKLMGTMIDLQDNKRQKKK